MTEKLVAIFKIIEYKDGAIFKTKFSHEEWVPMDTQMYSIRNDNEQIVTLSTKRQTELNWKTYR